MFILNELVVVNNKIIININNLNYKMKVFILTEYS